MKARLLGQYRSSKSGNVVFRYEITGTQSEIEAYKAIQGENFKTDEKSGKPLFFTTRFSGVNATLGFNKDNTKVYVDNSEMDAMNSLIEQHKGTALGDALAAEAAKKAIADVAAMAKVISSSSVTSIASVANVAQEAIDDVN